MADDKPVAVVTGAGNGIGAATVALLHKQGWRAAVADVRELDGSELAETDLSDDLFYRQIDVSDPTQVGGFIVAAAANFGRLDALVNNAGMTAFGSIEQLSPADWRRVLDVNLNAAFYCSQAAIPYLKQQPSSSIVNVVSVAARRGAVGRSVYGVSKAALEALTRGTAMELARDGVRVNAIGPGYVRTRFVSAAIDQGRLAADEIEAAIPMGRLAEPSEIAAVIAFLVSPVASYITGQTLFVDGGFLTSYGVPAHVADTPARSEPHA